MAPDCSWLSWFLLLFRFVSCSANGWCLMDQTHRKMSPSSSLPPELPGQEGRGHLSRSSASEDLQVRTLLTSDLLSELSCDSSVLIHILGCVYLVSPSSFGAFKLSICYVSLESSLMLDFGIFTQSTWSLAMALSKILGQKYC